MNSYFFSFGGGGFWVFFKISIIIILEFDNKKNKFVKLNFCCLQKQTKNWMFFSVVVVVVFRRDNIFFSLLKNYVCCNLRTKLSLLNAGIYN